MTIPQLSSNDLSIHVSIVTMANSDLAFLSTLNAVASDQLLVQQQGVVSIHQCHEDDEIENFVAEVVEVFLGKVFFAN